MLSLRITVLIILAFGNFRINSQIITDCGNFLPIHFNDSCETKLVKISSYKSFWFWGVYNIPKEVFEYKQLKSLEIYNIPINGIPKEIRHLKNLENLFISYTHISTLPPEISILDSLKYLTLINSRLKELPEQVTELRSLTSLSIQGNNKFNYDSLGFHLRNTNLNSIGIGNRSFKKLDSSFTACQKLENIQIYFGKKIDYILLIQTLNQLKKLKEIQFNQCRFTRSEVQFLEKIRPNVKLQFVNCKTPKNAINELRVLLKNTNEVIIGHGYKPKSYGSF